MRIKTWTIQISTLELSGSSFSELFVNLFIWYTIYCVSKKQTNKLPSTTVTDFKLIKKNHTPESSSVYIWVKKVFKDKKKRNFEIASFTTRSTRNLKIIELSIKYDYAKITAKWKAVVDLYSIIRIHSEGHFTYRNFLIWRVKRNATYFQ